MRKVVITGGAGYIGRHVCLALMTAGYTPVIFDSFTGASRTVLNQLQYMLGKPVQAQHIDLMDVAALRDAFRHHQPAAVIHLATPPRLQLPHRTDTARARTKAIDEHVWLGSSVMKAMQSIGCHTLVCASSHHVYAAEWSAPRREHDPTSWSDALGYAHLALEDVIEAVAYSNPTWRIGVLRLFEVLGAHSSECLGPPLSRPTPNWLVELCHAATGMLPHATVHGHDLPTADGSPIRDFVHVEDVAQAFTKALDALELYGEGFTANIGSGTPTSLIESVQCFEEVCDRAVKTRLDDPLPSAAHSSVADITLARELLGWQPQHTLASMCAHTWRWHDAYIQKRLPA
jgi:UDP-glucose 4-epimerase